MQPDRYVRKHWIYIPYTVKNDLLYLVHHTYHWVLDECSPTDVHQMSAECSLSPTECLPSAHTRQALSEHSADTLCGQHSVDTPQALGGIGGVDIITW